jgi:hypothetical protein
MRQEWRRKEAMKYRGYGKIKVYGIILLFLGMSLIPSVGSLRTQQPTSFKPTGLDGVNWTATKPDGDNGWYRKGVTLTCTFDHGLIAEVDYRYTGTDWQAYTSPVNITTEGIIEFEWYCVYVNGTVSRPQGPIRYPIDRTPPEVEVETQRYWNKIKYTAEVEDNNGGLLDRIEFWIGPYLEFTQTIADPSGEQTAVWILSPVPRIPLTITVKVYDLAGNMGSGNVTVSCSYQPNFLHFLRTLFGI